MNDTFTIKKKENCVGFSRLTEYLSFDERVLAQTSIVSVVIHYTRKTTASQISISQQVCYILSS